MFNVNALIFLSGKYIVITLWFCVFNKYIIKVTCHVAYHSLAPPNYLEIIMWAFHILLMYSLLFSWMLSIAIVIILLSHIFCTFLVLVDFWCFSLSKTPLAIIFKDQHESILNRLLFWHLNNTFIFLSLILYKLTV